MRDWDWVALAMKLDIIRGEACAILGQDLLALVARVPVPLPQGGTPSGLLGDDNNNDNENDSDSDKDEGDDDDVDDNDGG
ncbi:GH19204 [Drosophila grimshawi]|uniref:GH19204 n=1 Tax=Drosophila grimshawi TaxID=7222 RepID=B4JEY4_DROGR|nr:GH19204 [Drosophila grimshawi]